MIKKMFAVAGFVGGLITLSPSVHATILGPGQFCFVCTLPSGFDTGSSKIADTGVVTKSNSGVTTSFEAQVWREASGFLDFYFQFSNDASSDDVINILAVASFKGFTTDVGWQGAGVAPDLISRNPTGATINFYFISGVAAGESSPWLIVRTNALIFTAGKDFVQDGFQTPYDGYAPGPEPASIVLLGTVLALSAFFMRRRFASKS